jgi:hypothetical protein
MQGVAGSILGDDDESDQSSSMTRAIAISMSFGGKVGDLPLTNPKEAFNQVELFTIVASGLN